MPGSYIDKRSFALNFKSKKIAPDAWPRHFVRVDSETNWPPYNLARHIAFQTWMANAIHRTDLMILHTKYWDNMPEALDPLVSESAMMLDKKSDDDMDLPF